MTILHRPWPSTKKASKQDSFPLLLELALICGLVAAIGAPRLSALNRFVTSDEGLWLKYSGWFYYALNHHDFATTFQVSHPGVTVMWAGVIGFRDVYPAYKEDYADSKRPIGLGVLAKRDSTLPIQILRTSRVVMSFLHILVLSVGYWYARQLFGTMSALVGFALIAFDPFHIALSKILQPDGLLADLMLLSVLALLAHISDRRPLTLVVSAVAAGLAWLTKSPSLFLIPLTGILLLFAQINLRSGQTMPGWGRSLLQVVKVMAIWLMVGALVFCLLWPAMWVNPVGSLFKMLQGAVGYAETGHESPVFFNGKIYSNGDIPDVSFYPTSFLWRTTPVTLLGLLAIALLFFRRMFAFLWGSKQTSALSENPIPENLFLQENKRGSWNMAILVLFSVGFLALMSMGLKKFDRYIIPSIIAIDLVAGVGLVWSIGWLGKHLNGKWRRFLPTGLLLLILIQGALAWKSFPYFFNYYNPLLGSSERAAQVMQIGWGEGLDQAARYINSQPHSDQLQVLAWYGIGPFSYLSKSKVAPLDIDHPWTAEDWKQFDQADYVVVYIHQWQRDLPGQVLDRLASLKPEHSVWIGGLEYVRIYKIRGS